jgi:hypothetical protein
VFGKKGKIGGVLEMFVAIFADRTPGTFRGLVELR